MTTLEVASRLLVVLLLVGANALFVAAEFALVSAHDTRLTQMESRGDRLATRVLAAQKDLNLYLSSCQVGITLASLGLGWVGEPTIARTLIGWFGGLPSPLDVIAGHGVAGAIAFGLITFLHVVLGELMPKAVAIFHPETVARWSIWPLLAFTRIGAPVIWSLNGAASVTLRIFGVRLPAEAERVHSPEEIKLLVRRSQEVGQVERDEQAMIHGVFELTQTVAREVMTPRRDIVAVPTDVAFEDLLEKATRSGHTRLPVYDESLDNVVGVVLVKDLLQLVRSGLPEEFDVRAVMREPHFVPDTKPVDDLLAELQRLKIHMAIVVDEFGGTDGLVTLEDLIEEIVGEIYDEYDVARPLFTITPQGEALIDGGAPIDEVNERFSLRLPQEEYDTIGGFILGELGHIPRPGDRVTVEGAVLVVERVLERRVKLVRLRRKSPEGSMTAPVGGEGEGGGGGRSGV